MIYKPQSECPILERYKAAFDITDRTIIAYDKVIYCNEQLPFHLEIHERRHLIRQEKQGVDEWVEKYINDKDFRLKEELIAYKEQCASIPDRNLREKLRIMCAKDLSSPLYGSIISFQEALKLLHAK
jgi:hypothetical protein